MLITVKITAYIYKNLRYPKIAILLTVALVNISAFFLLHCSTKSNLIERKINSYIRKHIYFSLCSQVPHTLFPIFIDAYLWHPRLWFPKICRISFHDLYGFPRFLLPGDVHSNSLWGLFCSILIK